LQDAEKGILCHPEGHEQQGGCESVEDVEDFVRFTGEGEMRSVRVRRVNVVEGW
jgi:hypothetical protein